MPQGEGVGRVFPHRRAPRATPEKGALQHAHLDERLGRGCSEVSQDHAVGANRRLVSGQLHLRIRRTEGSKSQPHHLRRWKLSGDLAGLRDERSRADRAVPRLYVSGQGPAGDHGESDGVG